MKNLLNLNFGKKSLEFLWMLLLADLVFIIIHILFLTGLIDDSMWSVELESGYPEMFQHIKEFWILILLLLISRDKKQLIYLAWSALFFYVLIDDSFAFHEKVGNYLTNYLDFKPIHGLKVNDVGELMASAFFGLSLLALLGITYKFSDQEARDVSKHLMVLFVLLVFVGVFVDAVHVAFTHAKGFLGIIEDGGEMIIMSVIAWYAFGYHVGRKAHALSSDK